jgi:hypothetical protein
MHVVFVDQMRDAMREYACLARPSTRHDKQRPTGMNDRVKLFGVQTIGKVGSNRHDSFILRPGC